MLTLLPAVDVADGQAVRLVQGAAGSETRYGDPLEAALAWQRDGASWVHLVDLDAAFGRGSNAELLGDVIRRLDVNVELSGEVCADTDAPVIASGGVSTLDDLRALTALEPDGVEGVITGKALYAGAFTVAEALAVLAS